MVWEGDPLPSVAAGLKERGVASVVFEPCARTPGQGEFLSVMRSGVDQLENAGAAAASGGD